MKRVIPLVLTLVFFKLIISAHAIQMSGTKFKLNLQFRSQVSSPSAEEGKEKEIESGQAQVFQKDLYEVSLGYGSADVSPIGIAVSPSAVDFGSLAPTSAVTRLQVISTQKGPAPSYSLFIAEDHPPQDASGSGKFIPNSTGDKDKITTAQAGYWINPLTYGFGYRAKIKDKNALGFEKEDTYKQLPSLENGNPPSFLLRNDTQSQEVTTILKINISNAQADTLYQNTIYYTLIPSL